jgi:hypothetical protein
VKQCLHEPKYFCSKLYKTGKGKWDDSRKQCLTCEVFLKKKQVPLEVSIMGKAKATAWIEQRLNVANEERKRQLKEKGFAEFWKAQVGESQIEVVMDSPARERDGNFGRQAIFRIKIEDKEYDFSVNMKSPLYRSILEMLVLDKPHFTLVRSGQGKDTRYDIKGAW